LANLKEFWKVDPKVEKLVDVRVETSVVVMAPLKVDNLEDTPVANLAGSLVYWMA